MAELAADLKTVTVTLRLPRLFGVRMRICAWLVGLAGKIAPITMDVVMPYDESDPATYERANEESTQGGRVVLVRYPEGYRLRCDGLTVWAE